MKNKSLIFGCILCLFVTGCSVQGDESAQSDLDYQLLEAVRSDKFSIFKSLLKKGANPNAIFGPKESDWVMCEVTEKENMSFLRLVLDYGGDVNLRNQTDGVSLVYSAPVFCALSRNFPVYFETVKVLLENGANPSMDACSGCKPYSGSEKFNKGPITNVKTPLMHATGLHNWDAAELILDRKIVLEKEFKLRWQEENRIVYEIETAEKKRYTSEGNAKRLKFAKRLMDLGIEMKPGVGKENSRIKFPKWGEPAVW